LTPGVNFINGLLAAFAHTEPKSVKKTVKLSVFLRFRDLRTQKQRINMLVKLTPDVIPDKFLQVAKYTQNLTRHSKTYQMPRNVNTGRPRFPRSFYLFIHECKISLKCQIPSQNVSCRLRIQYLRSKILEHIYRE